MRLPVCILAIVLALAAPARSAPRDDSPQGGARELIARLVEAYGGRDSLEKVRAYRMEGRVVSLWQEREGPTTRLFARPDRLRVELLYPDEPEIRVVAGDKGWRGLGGDVDEVSGPLLESMILQAARAAVPWILMERAADARRIDPMDHRGRKLEGIEIELEHGLTFRAYVNPQTHRVELSQGLLVHGGMQTAFETVYGDFRRVGGILFAFREENYAAGAHAGYTAIERVEVNPEISRRDFGPPRSKADEI